MNGSTPIFQSNPSTATQSKLICVIWGQMKLLILILLTASLMSTPVNQTRPRARDVGITVGILPTGTLNAITDVDGVLVGHTTLISGDNVRTGVTAILPHGGNLFQR